MRNLRNYLLCTNYISLCYRTDAVAQRGGTYASGAGPIWGTNVICTGEEGRLVDCGFSNDTSSCTHSNDAGVTCNVTGEQAVDTSSLKYDTCFAVVT